MSHAGPGDHDEAFAWLERAADDRSLNAFLLSPTLRGLQADPRFHAQMRRLGLPLVRPGQ